MRLPELLRYLWLSLAASPALGNPASALELNLNAQRGEQRCEVAGDADLNADNLVVREGSCRLMLPYEQYRFCALARYRLDTDAVTSNARGTMGCGVKLTEFGDGVVWAFDAILSEGPSLTRDPQTLSCQFRCEPPPASEPER